MEKRNNSVEQACKQFMENGGVFLGKEEWEEILKKIPNMYKKYQKVHPKIDFQGYNFIDELFAAAARKAGGKVVDGKWEPFYFETRIRKNGRYYTTFLEINGGCVERMSEKSEVVGYLAWKIIKGEITFEQACGEIRRI